MVALSPSPTDEGGVDLEFVARPRVSCVVEILGGVGESGENEDLADRFAVAVGGGLGGPSLQ